LVQAIRLWHVTTDARVQSQSIQCEIWGVNKLALGQDFIPEFRFFPLHTASFHHRSVLTRPLNELYNLRNLERRKTTCLKMPQFFMLACNCIKFR
jgi:hypothetical protein